MFWLLNLFGIHRPTPITAPVNRPAPTAAVIAVHGLDGRVLLHLGAQAEPRQIWATMPICHARSLAFEIWRACKEAELPAA